jgi:hypothetical protein
VGTNMEIYSDDKHSHKHMTTMGFRPRIRPRTHLYVVAFQHLGTTPCCLFPSFSRCQFGTRSSCQSQCSAAAIVCTSFAHIQLVDASMRIVHGRAVFLLLLFALASLSEDIQVAAARHRHPAKHGSSKIRYVLRFHALAQKPRDSFSILPLKQVQQSA